MVCCGETADKMSLYDGLDIDDKPAAGKESKKPDVCEY